MGLGADTEMLEAICEKSSEEWAGTLSDASGTGVTVAPDKLKGYVGVYRGIYSERTDVQGVALRRCTDRQDPRR